jgi:hypothetical protein
MQLCETFNPSILRFKKNPFPPHSVGGRDKGIALVTVLLFLQILTLLGLYLLESTSWSDKLTREYWYKHIIFQVAEQKLSELNFLEVCRINPIPPEVLITSPLEWWEEHACQEQFTQGKYYYIYENLSTVLCQEGGNANYFRTTLLIYTKNQEVREILQNTIVKIDNANRVCHIDHQTIVEGRQGWSRL